VSISLNSSGQNSTNNLNSNALSTPIKSNYTNSSSNSNHMTASPLAQLLSEGTTSLTASTKGLITDVTASRAFKGVNSWLAGVVSPYMIADERGDGSEGNESGSTAGQGSERGGGGGIAYSSSVQSSSQKPPLMNGNNNNILNTAGFSNNPSTSNTNYNTPAAKTSHSRLATNSHKLTPPNSGHGSVNTPSLDELLLSAFCEDADGASVFDTAPDSMSHSNTHSNPREVVLEEEDWLIQLNTLAMVVSSVKNLHTKYTATMKALDARGRENESDTNSG
jgi:hypothetical protein